MNPTSGWENKLVRGVQKRKDSRIIQWGNYFRKIIISITRFHFKKEILQTTKPNLRIKVYFYRSDSTDYNFFKIYFCLIRFKTIDLNYMSALLLIHHSLTSFLGNYGRPNKATIFFEPSSSLFVQIITLIMPLQNSKIQSFKTTPMGFC